MRRSPSPKGSRPVFEVDHGVDPEWSAGTELAQQESVADVDMPPAAEEQPATVDEAFDDFQLDDEVAEPVEIEQTSFVETDDADFLTRDPALEELAEESHFLGEPEVETDESEIDSHEPAVEAGEPVTLTEVLEDAELFDDPSLEVARMASGEEREIIVPVEVGDPDVGLQRYKLTVRLRLDPVDD